MNFRIDHENRLRPGALVIFMVGYLLAVRLSEHAYGSLAVPSPFWLPDSVLLCALLVAPKRHWWILALAIWPLRLIAGAVPGTALWFQIVAILNDMLKGLAGAWLLRRFAREPIRLQTLREFMLFLVVAAAALPAVSALAAAPARAGLGDPMWEAAPKWFLGNAVAQVVVTPTLLYWCTRAYSSPGRLAELLLVYAGLAGALLLGFVLDHPSYSLIFSYLPLPFLVWAALRLGPFGTANAIALVAVASMLTAVRGAGLFASASPDHAVLGIQLFLVIVTIVLLSLAIVTTEREALVRREVELNGRLIEEQERERRRIARELHDDLGQRMALLEVDIEELAARTDISDEGRAQIAALASSAAGLAVDIRDLSHALHPTAIDVLGLEGALTQLCRDVFGRYGLRVELSCRDLPRLDRERSLCLFRVAQEALNNVAKHSGASLASVQVLSEDHRVTLSVCDYGRGFDPAGLAQQDGLGLVSMSERVRQFRGHVSIDAAPKMGTRVHVLMPLS